MRMPISNRGRSDSVKLFHLYLYPQHRQINRQLKQRDVIWQLIVESGVRNVRYQCRQVENSAYSLFILIFKRLVKDLFLSFEIYLLELSRSVYHA